VLVIDAHKGLGARAATAFGADFIWRHETRAPGRTISGIDAAIYTEAPLPGPTDPAFVERYHAGVLRVLAALGMIDAAGAPPAPPRPARRIVSGGNVDTDLQSASKAGLFIHKTRAGDTVARGQLLGEIIDMEGRVLETLHAPDDGWVVVLKRRPHVRPGDPVVGVAIADPR